MDIHIRLTEDFTELPDTARGLLVAALLRTLAEVGFILPEAGAIHLAIDGTDAEVTVTVTVRTEMPSKAPGSPLVLRFPGG